MYQASNFPQQLVNIFSCSRRNTRSCVDLKEVYGSAAKFGDERGASLGCRSNESTELDSDSDKLSTAGSETDDSSARPCTYKSFVKPPPGSETEDSSARPRTQQSVVKPPPGLSGPPGLELAVGDRYAPKKSGVNKGSNLEAKVSVPEASSKGKLEECLRDISASSQNDLASSLGEVLKRRLQREQNESAKNDLHPSLEKVLGTLTAEDAAIVKAAFKTREVPRAANPPQTIRFPPRTSPVEGHRSQLRKLAEIDPKRVFMVRKIKELGLSSPEILRTYFSKFGPVENVYVAHSVDKRHLDEDPQAQPIILPAGFGYIVMEKAEDVLNIFHQALEHTISDVNVSVTAYEHHTSEEVTWKEGKVGVASSPAQGPRFPTYTNITADNTLRSNLRKMSDVDANRIFMVRRINKLGFGSAQMLKTHFDKVGVVTDVFVTHNLDRRKIDQTNPNARPNVRPAGIGFVVMEKAEDVAAIFHEGLEHTVFGVNIIVTKYEHQISPEHLA